MVTPPSPDNRPPEAIGSPYWSLFANQDYRLMWLGQTFSIFGEALYQIAFYWLAYRLSSRPEVAGLVVAMAGAPYLVFGLIGGAAADRWNRKRIMLLADLLRPTAVAIVPLLGAFGPLEVWHLGLVAFLLTSARCFFYPALNASVTEILGDRERQLGISLIQAGFRGARLIGLSLGCRSTLRGVGRHISLVGSARPAAPGRQGCGSDRRRRDADALGDCRCFAVHGHRARPGVVDLALWAWSAVADGA
jgi:MFS family permease